MNKTYTKDGRIRAAEFNEIKKENEFVFLVERMDEEIDKYVISRNLKDWELDRIHKKIYEQYTPAMVYYDQSEIDCEGRNREETICKDKKINVKNI